MPPTASPDPPEPAAKEKRRARRSQRPSPHQRLQLGATLCPGQVRDLRPRWALEEAGIAYAVRKLDTIAERPADYYEEQPFGQVPSYHDDMVSLFGSGAIVLHIGRDCETLLPANPVARARDGMADRHAQQR